MRKYGFGIGLVGVVSAISALALGGAVPNGGLSATQVGEPPSSAALDGDTDVASEPVDGLPTGEVGALEVLDVGAMQQVPVAELAAPGGDGIVFARAPGAAPGMPAEDVRSIAVIRSYLVAGNPTRALVAAERYVDTHKRTRDRDAAWMVIGMLHREAGRHNSAADAFKRLRVNDGSLGMLGAWYEAEQELARGRHASAVSRCSDYRTKWPEGPHADACVEVIARAHAAQGHDVDARKFAKEWDEKHAKAPIAEQVELQLATWEAEHKVNVAIPHLINLALVFRAPLTGRVAEEMLADLHAAGHADAVIPEDVPSRQARAVSLRESGRLDEAWAMYDALRNEAAGARADEPRVVKWVADQAIPFGWRTRRFEFLAEQLAVRYEEKPTARDAWEIQNALGRAGKWPEAAAWCKKGMERHAGTREWRRKEEDIARTYLLAGDPLGARALLDVAALRPGPSGRRSAFMAGFAAVRAGEFDDAVARLTAVIDKKRDGLPEAHYWRAKAMDALGRGDEAALDRRWIADNSPYSWEGVLVGSAVAPKAAPFGRSGGWPGPELPLPPSVEQIASSSSFALAGLAPAASARGVSGFGSLAWAPSGSAADVAPPSFGSLLPRAGSSLASLERDLLAPPASYSGGWDEKKASDDFKTLVEKHGTEFPVLSAIEDLAHVGLYDLSGPMFAQFDEDVRKWSRQSRSPHYLAARGVMTDVEAWEPFYLYTRDHNHTARNLWGNWTTATTPESRLDGYRLAYPLAHDRFVWEHGSEHDVDPYLVLGLMRQESTYNPLAMSPVGARGAMQIMPKTGHLLADLKHDTNFTAGDLEDPVFAVGYGITYLGLLLDRFDGNFPLAVASYNGGPHNVSRWLAGTGTDVPVDVFVETLPYRETRNYVKQVTSNYATYVALYAPPGTALRVPERVTRDDKSVVDF